MPITPFHFGPGAVLHATAPKYISFLSFCAANILTDVEPLYYMVTHQSPLHRFLHTYIGASLTSVATTLVFVMCKKLSQVMRLPDLLYWQSLSLRAVVVGATLGSYTHIILDSMMHADMHPLAPFSSENRLLNAISLSALHGFCMIAAGVGLAILGVRAVAKITRE